MASPNRSCRSGDDPWLSLKQASQRAGWSDATSRRRVAEGLLPAYKATPTSPMRFRAADVDALMRPIEEFASGNASRPKRQVSSIPGGGS